MAPEPIEAPAADDAADDDGDAGDRERAGRDLQRHAAIGEQRDDMNDGAVDRHDTEKERDRQSQKCLVASAAAASMPGNAAALAAPARPDAVTHGGSRTNRTTGSQASTTTAMPSPT